MPDPTDNYALVPHALEELHNVDAGTPVVGDVLTVASVADGVPTWEATAPGAGTWQQISLSTDEGDWFDESGDPEYAPGYDEPVVTLVPGSKIRTAAGLSGAGVALATSSRRQETQLVVRTKRTVEPMGADGAWALMYLRLNSVNRTVKWRWATYDESYQIQVSDGWGVTTWATVDDWTEWQDVVITLRIPDWGPGYTLTVDGEYANTTHIDPEENDALSVLFEVESSGPASVDVDLANSYVQVRTI